MGVARAATRWVLLCASTVTVGCVSDTSLGELPGEDVGLPGDEGSSSGSEAGEDPPSRDAQGIDEQSPADVDILFVVNNSMSMAPWVQEGGMIGLIDPLVAKFERLRREGKWSSYRVAVTTADMGNPACNLTTSEEGALVWQTCRDRRGDFYDGNGTTDALYAGCFAHCPAGPILAGQGHPWLHIDRDDPTVLETTVRDSLRCMIPQGISGCEFGSPLAATMRALQRMNDPEDPAYGFQRDEAHLVVIVVSNTPDCSYRGLAESIFEAEGDRAFWSDPTGPRPTPAVCWNAGVNCRSSFAGRLVCEPQHYDLDGAPADRESAVLVPVEDYVEDLRAIQDAKRERGADVWLLGVTGVEEEFEAGGGLWCDAAVDPDTLHEYGIEPSCSRPGMEQVRGFPPVRVHAVADQLHPDDTLLASICETSHGAVVDGVVAVTAAMAAPANCLSFCVADEGAEQGLQPNCFAYEDTGEKPFEMIPQCSYWCDGTPCAAAQANRWDYPPGAERCYHALTDANDSTASELDDMDDLCRARGSNMQAVIERKNPAEHRGKVHINCAASSEPQLDCPFLP